MPQPNLFTEPNKFTKKAGISLHHNLASLTGYQQFNVLNNSCVAAIGNKTKVHKYHILEQIIAKHVKNNTVLDLGSANGMYCFCAKWHGATNITGVDMDKEHNRCFQTAIDSLKIKGINIIEQNIQEYNNPADVVFAFALVHWIYSCTSLFGSIDAIMKWLRSLTNDTLIVEFISPEDPAIKDFGHINYNKEHVKGAYTRQNFIKAMEKHFDAYEKVAETKPTREIFVAYVNETVSLRIIKTGKTADITISSDNTTVSKTVDDSRLIDAKNNTYVGDFNVLNREIYWLKRMQKYNCFPKLIGTYPSRIVMSYCGEPLCKENLPREYRVQSEYILKCLKLENCSHNDIKPENLLIKDGILHLIDFQWATEIGEFIPDSWPEKIGSKFRKGNHDFDDTYSMNKSLEACNYLTDFVQNIKNDTPFSFARYGDGEWSAILNKKGCNCDGHEYFPDMGKRLGDIVKSKPSYLLGMQARARRLMGKEIDNYMKEVRIKWMRADVLHFASLNGDLAIFFEALKGKTVVIVGPKHLSKLDKFHVCDFFPVPDKNCWLSYDKVYQTVGSYLTATKKHTVVLFAASMMANVLIDDLYKKHGQRHTLLDIGSALDPYAWKKTRKYHKTLNI